MPLDEDLEIGVLLEGSGDFLQYRPRFRLKLGFTSREQDALRRPAALVGERIVQNVRITFGHADAGEVHFAAFRTVQQHAHNRITPEGQLRHVVEPALVHVHLEVRPIHQDADVRDFAVHLLLRRVRQMNRGGAHVVAAALDE